MKQRVELKSNPGFTKKELYRRHNYAKSNIHRGLRGRERLARLYQDWIPPKRLLPSHPSSSSNATNSDADVAIVAGAASGAASETETPVCSDVARADANASPPKKSSTPREGKKLKEAQRTDSDVGAAIGAGSASDAKFSETPVCEVARADANAIPPKKSSTPQTE